jgi:hypothetical protein
MAKLIKKLNNLELMGESDQGQISLPQSLTSYRRKCLIYGLNKAIFTTQHLAY